MSMMLDRMRSTVSTLFLLMVIVVSCSQKRVMIDQAKFESLYRAAKAIEASITVCVTYAKFGELLQSFATEVSIAKDRGKSPEEMKLIGLYFDVLTAYNDSQTVWKAKIDDARYQEMREGQIPADSVEVAAVAGKYGLKITERRYKYVRGRYNTIPPDSIQAVWSVASEKLKQANSYYYSEDGKPNLTPTAAQ